MENKQNFAGIIIPVIVAVILLTVLPIINSINKECPPCGECPSYNIGNIEVNPDFSSGNYEVDKDNYDYLDNVIIVKDDNLIPENIKNGVNVFGIIGTYQISLPTLYAPTISINDDTLIITPNSNNGAFVTGYKIYVDDALLDTITSTTYDLSEELTEEGTYEIYVKAYATLFIDSEPSNVENYVVQPVPSSYTVTLSGEYGGSSMSNVGFIYVKINNAPTDDNDYDISLSNGSLTWENKSDETVTSLENVTKIYIWAGELSQYYKINSGSYIELEGGNYPHYLRAIEIKVTSDIILTGKTNELSIWLTN